MSAASRVLAGLACAGAAWTAGAARADWTSRVGERIAAEEYHVTWQPRTQLSDVEAAWHAPNRAHGFRTYFTQAGPRLIPRTEAEPSWEWGLALLGYGRGGQSRAVPRARLEPAENRIDYERGPVTEWYENSPRGLKQGFVLWVGPDQLEGERIPGAAPRGPRARPVEAPRRSALAHLDLRPAGTLEPAISADGQAVDFGTGRGAYAIRYAELRLTDARGRELRAWIEGFSGAGFGGLRIVFEDEGAAYPVTIDPLATAAAWTAESDQPAARFGWSVATAGDVDGDGYADVIVGADQYDNGHTDEGRAYVYRGSASGLETTPAWTAESDQAGALFGTSVATAGDVNGDGFADVIVGAYRYDNGESDEGRSYVYHGSAAGLATTAAWSGESDQADAGFGSSVATAGDVNGDGYSDIVVGTPLYDACVVPPCPFPDDGGRIHVYHGSATGLSAAADWTEDGNEALARFGIFVATAGDVDGDGYADVIVGSDRHGPQDEGRAYVYRGSAAGLAAAPAWTAGGNQASASFGRSVGTAGDVNGDGYADVIVGAPGFDNGQADEGRAYVYQGSASGIAATAAWAAESNQASAFFGSSVGTAGDVDGDGYADVIVGAWALDNGEQDEGRAYVYRGSASGLASAPEWTAESDQALGSFGSAVATAGDVNGDGRSDVIVGAPGHDNGEADEGRASVYHGSSSGLAPAPGWTADGAQTNSFFGISVGTAGDVNGDGYADAIVGATGYDAGQSNEGRAYVYHGSAAGPATTPAWTAESDQANAFFGEVGTAGDVNGDGYADVIVGAAWYDNGQVDEGRAYVYHGSATGLSPAPAWTAESDQDLAHLGSVATAGDVNGDGYSDVIVGAYEYDNGQVDEGRAYVYHGSATGLAPAPAWMAEGGASNVVFGLSVATAGDVNGDAYSDVIVGAPAYVNAGRAYVYHGSAAGLAAAPAWAKGSIQEQEGANFGRSVGTAGDVNGDGYAEVIVGAYAYDAGETDEGRAYVYYGTAGGLASGPGWVGEVSQANAHFGAAVGTAGDVNGDGYSDVIVGAPRFDTAPLADEGQAFVYHGSAAGLAATPAWTAQSTQVNARLGRSVGAAGDVNGDGYSDVIVGGPGGFPTGPPVNGWAYVYYGNRGPGLALRPEQRRADDTGLVSRLGHMRSAEGFRLAAIGRSPFGRGNVRLEWEVEPLGQLLDGAGTHAAATWSDGGTAGAQLDEFVAVAETGAYHWRMRLRYDPVSSPFLAASRWFTIPWASQEETDLVQSCILPQAALFVFGASKDALGQPTLHFEDPNPPERVTGYNVYRSSNASLPPESWTLVGSNVQDAAPAVPGVQWTDLTPGGSPTGIWFYAVFAYNTNCGAEGP